MHPTPYPKVNALLGEVLAEVRSILGERFVGMYLFGSLATGGYDPQRSDIDLLVVTDGDVPDKELADLQALHARMAADGRPLAAQLEGSYIPRQSLRRYDPAHARHPHLSMGGGLRVEQHDSDWVIQRHVLRQHGLALAGPPAHTLIDPVLPNELRQAVVDLLRQWWAPMLDDPWRLEPRGYRVYAILTMCRCLYTLQHGTVVTKAVAARWAQGSLDGRWTALIERAFLWPRGEQAEDLGQTLDLIRYTLERAGRNESRADEA